MGLFREALIKRDVLKQAKRKHMSYLLGRFEGMSIDVVLFRTNLCPYGFLWRGGILGGGRDGFNRV